MRASKVTSEALKHDVRFFRMIFKNTRFYRCTKLSNQLAKKGIAQYFYFQIIC